MMQMKEINFILTIHLKNNIVKNRLEKIMSTDEEDLDYCLTELSKKEKQSYHLFIKDFDKN